MLFGKYVGLWQRERVVAPRDFDFFYIRVNVDDKKNLTGKGLDYNKGLFQINGELIETREGKRIMEFSKKYEKNIPGTENLNYSSEPIDNDTRCINGIWRIGDKGEIGYGEGDFTMSSPQGISLETLEKKLLQANINLIYNKMKELQEEFPFSQII